MITIALEGERCNTCKSRFTLTTLRRPIFRPSKTSGAADAEGCPEVFKWTAGQDPFLDGAAGRALLFERNVGRNFAKMLRTVATDGHRLALRRLTTRGIGGHQVIVPRKGVLELQRLLGGDGQSGNCHRNKSRSCPDRRYSLHFEADRRPFSGIWPSDPADPPQSKADRDNLRAALQRAAILSNEKYRGIRLSLKPNALLLQSHNPEQEEAEEELEVAYSGEEVEIGFNVNYLLDALAAVEGGSRHRTHGREQQLTYSSSPDTKEVRRDADAALAPYPMMLERVTIRELPPPCGRGAHVRSSGTGPWRQRLWQDRPTRGDLLPRVRPIFPA